MNRPGPISSAVRSVACGLVLAIVWTHAAPNPAFAMLAPAQAQAQSSAMNSPSYDRAADAHTVQKALENKLVRERLKDLGLNDKEVQARLDHLSDEQLHQLATHIHTLAPAGDDFTVPGILILVLVIVLIIYLVKRI